MDLQGILDRAVARGAAPGLSAAVRRPGRDPVVAVSGRAGVGEDAPALTPDMRLWIASCTKAISSLAALQLVEAGVLDLDAPLGDLGRPDVLEGFDGGGAPVTRKATRPLTLRALLSHTSGYAYDFLCADLLRWMLAMGRTPPATAHDAPLMFEPGERWLYGIGIDVAGRVIESAAGEPLDRVISTRVLEPLGMSTAVSSRALGRPGRAWRRSSGRGVSRLVPSPCPPSPISAWPAGVSIPPPPTT